MPAGGGTPDDSRKLAAEAPSLGLETADSPALSNRLALQAFLEKPPDFIPPPRDSPRTFLYTGESAPPYGAAFSFGKPRLLGRLFKLFILMEWKDRLFIIDQHAAHEWILYNRLMSAPIARQELLAPIIFETESPVDDDFLDLHREALVDLGIMLNREGPLWRIDALPASWELSDSETVQELLALKDAKDNMAERWAAVYCCHKAVKDGDYLDDIQAEALALEALALPEPRCPHGRPIWAEVSRSDLFKAVRRS